MDPGEARRREEAIAWFAALRRGDMSESDRARYDAWRADAANQAAMDSVRELWGELNVLKELRKVRRRALLTRKLALPLAAAAFAAFGLTAIWLSRTDTVAVRTAVGEQRTQSLSDGSILAVNVASNLSYAMKSDSRLIVLDSGEAAFTVKPDEAAPFVVRAGRYEIRAVGTEFNVRNRDGMLEIAVASGQVQICALQGVDAGEVLATLSTGEALRLPQAGLTDRPDIPDPVSIEPGDVAEWRTHVVSYENATVDDVVGDLNRYFDRKLVVGPESLSAMRVTIRLQVQDREKAISTLAGLLSGTIRVGSTADVLEH